MRREVYFLREPVIKFDGAHIHIWAEKSCFPLVCVCVRTWVIFVCCRCVRLWFTERWTLGDLWMRPRAFGCARTVVTLCFSIRRASQTDVNYTIIAILHKQLFFPPTLVLIYYRASGKCIVLAHGNSIRRNDIWLLVRELPLSQWKKAAGLRLKII